MELWLIVTIVIMGASFVHSVLVLSGIVRPRRDGFDAVLEYVKAENEQIKKRAEKQDEQIALLHQQVNDLRQENMILRTQLVLLESAQYDLPYPQWTCDYDGTIILVNKAFEDCFLVPVGLSIVNVIGKTAGDFLEEEGERHFMEQHRWVLAQKRPWEGGLVINRNGKSESLDALFYPKFSGKQIIGVSGLIIPAKRTENY